MTITAGGQGADTAIQCDGCEASAIFSAFRDTQEAMRQTGWVHSRETFLHHFCADCAPAHKTRAPGIEGFIPFYICDRCHAIIELEPRDKGVDVEAHVRRAGWAPHPVWENTHYCSACAAGAR